MNKHFVKLVALISVILLIVVSCVSPDKSCEEVKASIYLNEGEVALFGYGSLVNVSSMEKTLNHKYSGPLILGYLKHWKRSWSVVMPNSYFYEKTANGNYFPQYILYLNITPSVGSEVYGALFVIKKDELNGFKKREWIYDFKDVSAHIKDVNVVGGPVYSCVAKNKYFVSKPDIDTMAVRSSYIETVENAYKSNGEESLEAFIKTTEGIPKKFIIKDCKHNNAKNPFGYK